MIDCSSVRSLFGFRRRHLRPCLWWLSSCGGTRGHTLMCSTLPMVRARTPPCHTPSRSYPRGSALFFLSVEWVLSAPEWSIDRSLLGCSIGCLCLCRPQLSPSSGSTRRPTWASSNSSSRRRVRLEHHPVRRRTPPALRCPALSPPHNRITLPWRCCAPRCASEI